MRKDWLINLALLVVIGLLAWLVFYTLEEDKPEKMLPLSELKATAIKNIRITKANQADIVLKKDEQGFWQMLTPFELPANSFHIDNLLRILAEQHYKILEMDKLELEKFKLAPPLVSVKFDDFEVAFGDSSPLVQGQRYVLINKKVYLLLDRLYYNTLNNDALRLLFLSPLGNKPKLSEIKTPKYHLGLKEGKWTVISGLASDISADELSALIDNWKNASAFRIEPYLEVEGTSQGEIEFKFADKKPALSLKILSTKPDFVLARPDKGVQYTLPANQVEKLLR
jgi:hypothetical protein